MTKLSATFVILFLTQNFFSQLSVDVQGKGLGNSTWLLNKNISDMGATQDYTLAWGSSYGVAANAYFGMTGLGIEFLYNTHNASFTGAYSVNDVSTGSYTSNIKLQTILRNAGISTEIYPGESKLKKQMEYANKIKSPAVILYGEDEIKSSKPTLRNLSTGKEKSIEIKELVNEIKKII